MALGIAAFCLTAIFGVLSLGSTNNKTTVEQTAAAGLASAIVSDLRALNTSNSTSSIYQITIPSSPSGSTQQLKLREDGALDSTGGAESRYLGYVTFYSPATSKSATPVRILITWPAVADLNNNPPRNFSGSYEVVTALDRN